MEKDENKNRGFLKSAKIIVLNKNMF